MITIGANGQRIAYGIKHYNLDDESDLLRLPHNTDVMGCTCFVIKTSKYYMLNSKLEWVEITPFGTITSSGGSGGGDTPGGGEGDSGDGDDSIIYEGGII